MSSDDPDKRAQTTIPDVVLGAAEDDPQDIMAPPPSRDELTERLKRRTAARI